MKTEKNVYILNKWREFKNENQRSPTFEMFTVG